MTPGLRLIERLGKAAGKQALKNLKRMPKAEAKDKFYQDMITAGEAGALLDSIDVPRVDSIKLLKALKGSLPRKSKP